MPQVRASVGGVGGGRGSYRAPRGTGIRDAHHLIRKIYIQRMCNRDITGYHRRTEYSNPDIAEHNPEVEMTGMEGKLIQHY